MPFSEIDNTQTKQVCGRMMSSVLVLLALRFQEASEITELVGSTGQEPRGDVLKAQIRETFQR